MAGLRERKKERTRQRIAAVALRLFAERGFDAVTVAEVAEAAEVARATLFTYFPSKESLVLRGVGEDDLAGVVAARRADASPVEALREHFRGFATGQVAGVDLDDVVVRMRAIVGSPTLGAAANALLYRQRVALAEVLAGVYGQRAGVLMAAQVAATALALQESFFRRLAGGMSPELAGRALAEEVELGFGLLEHGFDQMKGE